MTGSYTCMTLLSTLIFDEASDEQKAEWVETIAKMGEEVISRESEIADYLAGDFNRVTYLGSGSLGRRKPRVWDPRRAGSRAGRSRYRSWRWA